MGACTQGLSTMDSSRLPLVRRQAASLFCILSQEVAGPKVGGFQKDLLPVIARCSTIANMTTVGAGSLASVSACFRCAHCGKWDRSLRPSEHGCGCTNVAIADGPFGACDACRAVFYCSRTCQSLHWPMHMGECAGRVDVPGVAWWKKGRDARETDANKQPRADVRDSGGLANGKENAGARVGAAKVGPLGMGGNRANVQAGEALGKQRAAGKRWRGCNCEFCVTFGWRGEGEGEGEDTEDEDEVEDTEDEDESDDDAEGEALSAVISASYEKAAQKARLASALMTEGPLECVQQ